MNYKTGHGVLNASKVIQRTHKATCRLNVSKHILWKSFIKTALNFSDNTTIHGIKYLAEDVEHSKGRYSKARIANIGFWLGVIASGFIVVSYLTWLVVNRFQLTPTINTIESNEHPVYSVPFPAVTICNVNVVYRPNTVKLVEYLLSKNVSLETIEHYMQSWAMLIIPQDIETHFLNITGFVFAKGYNIETLLLEVFQPCENLLEQCSWLGEVYPCGQLFIQTKSDIGLCCSFNTQMNSSKTLYTNGFGVEMALSVLIDVELDAYVSTTRETAGVDVLIHQREEFPGQTAIMATAQVGTDVQLSVTPSVMDSDESLRTLSSSQRGCWFSDEVKLRTTDVYNYKSCVTECKVDHFIKACACIPFFFYELDIPTYSVKYQQCGLRHNKCLHKYRTIFESFQPPVNLTEYGFVELDNSTIVGMQCNCLPCCVDYDYTVKAITSKLSENYYNSTVFPNATDINKKVTVSVFFGSRTCTKYLRLPYLTWDGFIATFGGIFSLCLGGSMISIMEGLYYLTFRWIGNYSEVKNDSLTLPKRKSRLNVIKRKFHKY